jgi:hypothetical protein
MQVDRICRWHQLFLAELPLPRFEAREREFSETFSRVLAN